MAKTTKQTLTWHHIRSKKDLPEAGKKVLLKIRESYGHRKHTYDYGMLTGIGITESERKRLLPGNARIGLICAEDKYGNNKVPWRWQGKDGQLYWGQDVKAWAEL